jgi:hypothetical protein
LSKIAFGAMSMLISTALLNVNTFGSAAFSGIDASLKKSQKGVAGQRRLRVRNNPFPLTGRHRVFGVAGGVRSFRQLCDAVRHAAASWLTLKNAAPPSGTDIQRQRSKKSGAHDAPPPCLKMGCR